MQSQWNTYICHMNSGPYILCIETSGPVCSVALALGNRILAEIKADEPNSHSSALAPLIENLLNTAKISFDELNAVALSAGPGSYTGLRIGMSTAKGLCYALSIPLISISTFDCMVDSFLCEKKLQKNDLIVPMIDARRMEVYTRVYNAAGEPITKQTNYISGEGNLIPFEPEANVYLIGSGAEKMLSGFNSDKFCHIEGTFISAAGIISLAFKRYIMNDFSDLAYTTPNYGKAWQKA